MNYQDLQQPLNNEFILLTQELKNKIRINSLITDPADVEKAELSDLIMMAKASFIPALFDTAMRLEKVDAAVCSFKLGMYGLCADCEEEIEWCDLEKDPAQPRCKACRENSRYHHG